MHTFLPYQVAVLDWFGGGLVHARGGQRTTYQPLVTTFPRFVGRSPKKLVQELHERLGVTHFYLADLDALQGRSETGATELALEILENGLTLWWDRGLGMTTLTVSNHKPGWPCFGRDCRPVLGTESCRSPGELFALLGSDNSRPWTLSLDLIRRDGAWHWFGHEVSSWIAPRSNVGLQSESSLPDRAEQTDKVGPGDDLKSLASAWESDESWDSMALSAVVARSVQLGVRELIVLNLADVGATETSTGPILQDLRRDFPTISLVAGGGVRDSAAIHRIVDQGANYVLTGTWLWTQLSQALPSRA